MVWDSNFVFSRNPLIIFLLQLQYKPLRNTESSFGIPLLVPRVLMSQKPGKSPQDIPYELNEKFIELPPSAPN